MSPTKAAGSRRALPSPPPPGTAGGCRRASRCTRAARRAGSWASSRSSLAANPATPGSTTSTSTRTYAANQVGAGIVDKARGGGMQEGTSSPLLFREDAPAMNEPALDDARYTQPVERLLEDSWKTRSRRGGSRERIIESASAGVLLSLAGPPAGGGPFS